MRNCSITQNIIFLESCYYILNNHFYKYITNPFPNIIIKQFSSLYNIMIISSKD